MNIVENVEENLLADDISTITSTLERSLTSEVDKVNHQPCTGPYLHTVTMHACLAGTGQEKQGSIHY